MYGAKQAIERGPADGEQLAIGGGTPVEPAEQSAHVRCRWRPSPGHWILQHGQDDVASVAPVGRLNQRNCRAIAVRLVAAGLEVLPVGELTDVAAVARVELALRSDV